MDSLKGFVWKTHSNYCKQWVLKRKDLLHVLAKKTCMNLNLHTAKHGLNTSNLTIIEVNLSYHAETSTS